MDPYRIYECWCGVRSRDINEYGDGQAFMERHVKTENRGIQSTSWMHEYRIWQVKAKP